jgi:hypothetical protein
MEPEPEPEPEQQQTVLELELEPEPEPEPENPRQPATVTNRTIGGGAGLRSVRLTLEARPDSPGAISPSAGLRLRKFGSGRAAAEECFDTADDALEIDGEALVEGADEEEKEAVALPSPAGVSATAVGSAGSPTAAVARAAAVGVGVASVTVSAGGAFRPFHSASSSAALACLKAPPAEEEVEEACAPAVAAGAVRPEGETLSVAVVAADETSLIVRRHGGGKGLELLVP